MNMGRIAFYALVLAVVGFGVYKIVDGQGLSRRLERANEQANRRIAELTERNDRITDALRESERLAEAYADSAARWEAVSDSLRRELADLFTELDSLEQDWQFNGTDSSLARAHERHLQSILNTDDG